MHIGTAACSAAAYQHAVLNKHKLHCKLLVREHQQRTSQDSWQQPLCIHILQGPKDCLVLVQIVNETLPALQQLKAQGLVRFVGITGLPLGTLRAVLERAPPGE
jgi:diketogulonate reductase-like aldo/keto reductase